MRDRIIFFVLGALLATLAYFAGDMQLSAHNTEIEGKQIIPKLFVEEIQVLSDLIVGGSGRYSIRMNADHEKAIFMIRDPDTPRRSIRMVVDHEGAAIDLLSPNGKRFIGLFVAKEAGEDGTFIAIGDGTRKIRLMDASSVNRFINP